ncbi:hypothetical protein L484_010066 [Morus notabilis]|uniref:Uncharacterized protein n=1 Tax=Morus notabilis TaxID=981085 RepID=W9RML3_9ROSA|nr:uncharacterized protein LOC21393375 isoform X1 [Morus notabilis]EXB87087.1 hypothetical protein L484_010066 [Morus notabilis]
MEPKETPFRAFGQQSIASSFLSPSSNPFKASKDKTKNEASEKGSLSDFLQRKLNETSGLPGTVKGKSKPFSSLLGPRESGGGSIDEQAEAKKGGAADLNSVVEKVVLEQFKHSGTLEGDCVGPSSAGGAENCDKTIVRGLRKRKNLEGGHERQIPRKHFAVLGGNLKLKQQRRDGDLTNRENLKTAYNHYANGGGWWDNNIEGVDNEEVGFSEVWEGVGSTTFGGIADWH